MLALAAAAGSEAAAREASAAPERGHADLVLITLDTTRSDYLGSYGASDARTPVLDALASRGVRYARALTASPLTLPAHASLLTGLEPPEHGLVENGTAVLDAAVPTLAERLVARGYDTAAFVSSRILDRRFGLDRGFATYDDRIPAERIGEYGYPERDAAAVTAAALGWLGERLASSRGDGKEATPLFLWVHYYDPHAPYDPPAEWRGSDAKADYAGEIAYLDREVGRLLEALAGRGRPRTIAVVGDHGESLGEHGERAHGIFLYRAALEVPLILAGPGIPPGLVVEETVATRRLAATLLGLLGPAAGEEATVDLGPVLPGLPLSAEKAPPLPVYSETRMPASAYGWSPLAAISDGRWRLIRAPRPELYDFVADPGELRNLIGERPAEARRLARVLAAREEGMRQVGAERRHDDPELAGDLRSLGYLSGSRAAGQVIDPKDGVALLAELERAKGLMRSGALAPALEILRDLVARNRGNVPFHTQLASAELAAGNGEEALAALGAALELAPGLDFLHLHLAEAYTALGRPGDAREAYRSTLALNPRAVPAWLGLAELAHRAGRPDEERDVLAEAVRAGAASAAIHIRLGQIESAAGEAAAARGHYRTAVGLAPAWTLPRLLWGELEETEGSYGEALEHYAAAVAAEPSSPAAYLRMGRLYLRTGAEAAARANLERAAQLAPRSPEGREAIRLLGELTRD